MNQHIVPLTDSVPLAVSFNHNLPQVPAFVRMVLLCTQADAASALNIGDELNADSVFDNYNDALCLSFHAGGTDIQVVYSGCGGGNANFAGPGGTVRNFTDFTNFSLKIYWQ